MAVNERPVNANGAPPFFGMSNNLFARRDGKPLEEQLERMKDNAAARLRGKERRRAERESGDAPADQPRKQRVRKPRPGETPLPAEPEHIHDADLPETHRRAQGLQAASATLQAALLGGADATTLRDAFAAAKELGLDSNADLSSRAEVRLLEIEIAVSTSTARERQLAKKGRSAAKAGAAAQSQASRRCPACCISFSSLKDLETHACFAAPSDPAGGEGRGVAVAASSAQPGPSTIKEDCSCASGAEQPQAAAAPAQDGRGGEVGPSLPAAPLPQDAPPRSTALGLLGAYDSEDSD